jgi:hypothetical protein
LEEYTVLKGNGKGDLRSLFDFLDIAALSVLHFKGAKGLSAGSFENVTQQ